MKTVKSLLLGSAAGLAAFTGAQAADLPVKARAVEYVRICSIYGAGFYYIPGTDTCLKVGGFVRADIDFWGQENNNTYRNGGAGQITRDSTANYNTRYRGIVSMDARSQTEYGTLRAYFRAGWELNSSPTAFSATAGGVIDAGYRGPTYFDRAFIQFAGLTVGKTQSFFDFYAQALNYTTSFVMGSDTNHGINLLAYTAQFAGGFSATISLEDTAHRRTGMWDSSTNGLANNSSLGGAAFAAATSLAANGGVASGFIGGTAGATAGATVPNTGSYGAQRYPDVVANLRVDQPWGSAQIAAAVRDVVGGCYNATCNPVGITGDATGNAGSATGWAVSGGVKFNLPWAQGDEFWVQGTYARGASAYLGMSNFVTASNFQVYNNSAAGTPSTVGGGVRQGSVALLYAFDGLYQTGTGVALTEGWQVNAAIQHYWTPGLKTSVFGGYLSFNYDATATTRFCTGSQGTAVAPGMGANPGVCNPDFNLWQVGTRTVWTPVANLDIGVEVLYTKWDQKMVGDWSLAANGSRPNGSYAARDQDQWSGLLRFQRNFWP